MMMMMSSIIMIILCYFCHSFLSDHLKAKREMTMKSKEISISIYSNHFSNQQVKQFFTYLLYPILLYTILSIYLSIHLSCCRKCLFFFVVFFSFYFLFLVVVVYDCHLSILYVCKSLLHT